MRLFLAVAVLMLAFVAYTAAEEETVQEKLNKFAERVADAGRTVADGARTQYDRLRNSEFATNAKNWFQRQVEKLQSKS
uniref:Apolipoprotein C-I n=1 Tax=Cynoglossus semilaevis TaxID=244447 RepID=A0A3P8W7U9_CYNSE